MTAEPAVTPDPSPLARPGAGEGFFRADGDDLIPAEYSASPWGAVLHGRLIGGGADFIQCAGAKLFELGVHERDQGVPGERLDLA